MGQIKFYSLIDGFDPVDELGFLQAADRIKYTSGSVTTKHLELRECVCVVLNSVNQKQILIVNAYKGLLKSCKLLG